MKYNLATPREPYKKEDLATDIFNDGLFPCPDKVFEASYFKSACECGKDVTLATESGHIQYLKDKNGDRYSTNYAFCECGALHIGWLPKLDICVDK